MTELHDPDIRFHELFTVKSYSTMHLRIFIAEADDGRPLYITENDAGYSALSTAERKIFLLSQAEYQKYLQAHKKSK